MQWKIILAAAVIAVLPAMAQAQGANPCTTMDASLPPALQAWPTKTPLLSATQAQDLAKAVLAVGRAANVTLHHTREVGYVVQADKPGGSVAYGGMLELTVTKAGTYQFALGSGAWIDVVRGNTKMVSTAHGHGPACSTIRKIVAFPLDPGRYVIQISANGGPSVALLVAAKP